MLVQEGAHRGQQAAAVGGVRQEQLRLARKAAGVGKKAAPQATGLPPAVIGGVVAKAEEKRERDAKDRKRRGLDMGQGQDMVVDRDDGRGEGGDKQQLRRDVRQDRAAHREEQRQDPRLVAEDHFSARQPMSRRQKPAGQSMRSTIA